MYNIVTDKNSAGNYGIGGKAANLFRLKESGINVPSFLVLPQETFIDLMPQELKADEDIITFIEQITIPQNTIDNIISILCDTKYFAVRSSAIGEDSENFSFAGQLESYLFVKIIPVSLLLFSK